MQAIAYELRKIMKECFVRKKIDANEPNLFCDLPDRVVCVELNKQQHTIEKKTCERACEIVAALGGRPVVFIRYNPDSFKWKGKAYNAAQAEKVELLVNVIKDEITRKISGFEVKLMQLWYDDDLDEYTPCKIDDITSLAAA